MARKSADGSGSIRKKTVTRKGKQYTYWEARYSAGYDPGTGKQIQRSITGPTQKDVAQRLKAVTAALDAGTYTAPCKLTVGQWMDIWERDYLGAVKPSTASIYRNNIKNHIKPALGFVKLSDLRPHAVQRFVNALSPGLSPASVRLAYKVLHMALRKAVELGYLPKDPAGGCTLPKLEQAEICPLDDEQASTLLRAATGGDLEYLVTVALFTGLRISELLGLTWDVVDFRRGTVTVNKQLTPPSFREDSGLFLSPKNGKTRILTPAPSVMAVLKRHRARQAAHRLKAGELWLGNYDLVFPNEIGLPWERATVEDAFSRLLASAGLPSFRFHDLRHTYAVNSLRSGDDIKTLQCNLGHSSAAFTLDRYGHFTEQMKQDSAARMEGFMKGVMGL